MQFVSCIHLSPEKDVLINIVVLEMISRLRDGCEDREYLTNDEYVLWHVKFILSRLTPYGGCVCVEFGSVLSKR